MAEKIKTEVIRLGEGMSEEDRKELNEVLEKVKQQAEEKTAESETETEETSKVEPQEIQPCTRCGYHPDRKKPDQSDVEEYMRATLGSRRFQKAYLLMKGNLSVTFATIDTEASEKMNDIITQLTMVEDPVVFRGYLTKLQLVYFLKEYTIAGDTVRFELPAVKTTDELTAEFVKRFGAIDESVATMFTRALNSFVALKTALVESCFDEDFYKGAGPF